MIQDKYIIFHLDGISAKVLLYSVKNFINEGEIETINLNTNDKSNEYIEELIEDATKLIFIIPEFNGSYPGILKTFIDNLDTNIWLDKKAFIIGYSGGFSGNIQGVSHLTDVLSHLYVNIHNYKLYIPNIKDNLDINGFYLDNKYSSKLSKHLKSFSSY